MEIYRVTARGERRFVWCYSPGEEEAKQIGARYLEAKMSEMVVTKLVLVENEWRTK